MKGKISRIILSFEKYADALLTGAINVIVTLLWTFLWFPVAIKEAFNASYYSERPRKNILRRLLDNCYWVLRFHRANIFYNLYGLDVKGARTAPYIDEKGFWKGLNQLNYKKGVNSQVCLLRDKYLFYKYMNSNGIAVPEVFGVIRDGKCFDIELHEVNEEFFSDYTNYFIKDIDGECASFVKRVNDYSCLKSCSEAFKLGKAYILQNAIIQHPDMKMLNPEAINTLRVITVRDKAGQIRLECGSEMW